LATRHIGELRAVMHSTLAVIVWNDTGWCSDDIRVRHKRASDATLELYRRRKANREQENA
jgi:hypothetical protein